MREGGDSQRITWTHLSPKTVYLLDLLAGMLMLGISVAVHGIYSVILKKSSTQIGLPHFLAQLSVINPAKAML